MQPVRKPKNARATIRRILNYMKQYRILIAIVVVLVLVSSATSIAGTYFLKPLINNYIVPFIGKKNPDLTGLIKGVTTMGIVYVIGALSAYTYSRIMISVSTGTLLNLRKDLFNHLQTLPIKYFDSHTHGELMSRFTNDIDAIREMLSNTLTHLVSSSVTVVGVFGAMLILNPVLTIIVIMMLVIITQIIKIIGSKSGMFFRRQQKAVGRVNGYIEEMIEGQKVVKVFCHEDKAKAEFDQLNEELCNAAYGAHAFANVLMPIMGNLSYVHYALTAIVGSVLTIYTGFDIGSLASFLQYTRSFSHPITQMSQQFNSILSALAGAERIFEVLDQKPETDNGYVTLVNATYENGELKECENRTGIWAWKHPHHDGTVT
ncbi:MAG: ABC transporter ATP-binding protein, partial [Clostridia bacterium]|nr:ABC transporter ATP-binding protein [Clostridia bacterium]